MCIAMYAFAMHFTMLFSTGYTAVYTYTQTNLHDLLVANYTGKNYTGKVQYNICEVISGNMATINELYSSSCTYSYGVSVY